MSKIGAYNLDLQERANELGYETVMDAMNNGYELISGQLVQSVEIAFEERKKKNMEVLDRAIEQVDDELKKELEELKGEL